MSAHRQLNMISFPQLNWLGLDAEGNSNDSWSTEAIIIQDAQSLLSLRVSHIPHLKLASPANQLTALDFRPFPDATLALSVLEWSPNVVDFRGTVFFRGQPLQPLELLFLRSFRTDDETMLQYMTWSGSKYRNWATRRLRSRV
jgi:hypothetical protein